MANINNITNRTSIEHKSVCIKAGIIPGTGYAAGFCEYLLGTGATDWYVDDNGKIKYKSNVIKSYKKDWIKQRAGEKAKGEQEEALLAANDAEKINNKLNELEKNAKTTEEQIDAVNTKIQTLTQQIKNLEREKSDVLKAGKKANTSTTEVVDKLNNQISNLTKNKDEAKGKLTQLTQQLNNEKQTLKDKRDAAEKHSKGNKWWYKKLKEHKQKQFNVEAEKNATKPKSVNNEYTVDDLILLSVYANNNNNGENGTISWDIYDSDESLNGKLNSVLTSIWNNFNKITSIRNDMNSDILAEADAITPDSSLEFLKGAVSNTFEAAMLGKELLSNPDLIKQRATLLLDATTAALERLTSRVTNAMTNSAMQIMDVTPIIAIPSDAAQEMVKHIMTPAQVMQAISDALNDEKLSEFNDDALQKKINDTKEKFNETVQEINFLYGDKLNAFNKSIADIKAVSNQSADWYIDNVNSIERKLEKEALKTISDVTVNALDMKFQFRDTAVDVLAYNLVIPVNETLIKVQLEIIRALVQATKRAIAIAKAMAEKAIMQLLGLFGA